MEKIHCNEKRTGKNILVIDKKNIILELRDETKDIRAWMRSQKSYSSYIHQKAYITHEGKDRRPCLLHVVRDYDFFKIWILYEDSTGEIFTIHPKTIASHKTTTGNSRACIEETPSQLTPGDINSSQTINA